MKHCKNLCRYAVTVGIIASTIVVFGCTVSPEHKVRTGIDPRYQDKNVAFRTTYYFRVFDYCQLEQTSSPNTSPATDGLYRFKMTGKANTFSNQVKFESGVLKSWELDPLGATVVYDKNVGRHRYISEDETQNEAQQKGAWAEYQALQKEFSRLSAQVDEQIETKNVLNTELIAAVSGDAAIDIIALSTALAKAFSSSTTQIKSLNTNVQNAVEKSIKLNQQKILDNNSATLNTQFMLSAHEWLRTLIINELKTNIPQAFNQNNIPNNLLTTSATPVAWNLVVANTFTPAFAFTGANKNTYIESLRLHFKGEQFASNIADATLTVGGATEEAAKLLATDYINALSTFALKDLSPDFLHIFNDLLEQTPKDDNGKYIAFSPQQRQNIQGAAAKRIDIILATTDLLKGRANNFPASVNFQAVHSNILALVNQKNISEQLGSMSQALIETAVENTHFLASTGLNSTLQTLKTAMNNKLRLATGMAIVSNSSADSQSKSVLISPPIECGMNQRRGFQVLGPEGWRTFDQDSRLIMAMYVDNSPITQVLKQLSQQVLNAHKSSEPQLLPLVEAELRLSEARGVLVQQKAALDATTHDKKISALCELANSVSQKLKETSTGETLLNCVGDSL